MAIGPVTAATVPDVAASRHCGPRAALISSCTEIDPDAWPPPPCSAAPPSRARPGARRRSSLARAAGRRAGRLRVLERADREEFLALARESRELHRPWTYPPERADQFDDLYARSRRDDFVCLLACLVETGEIAGVFTVSQIVRGAFQSAYLGYYANARHAGQGLMREAMEQVLDHAFGPLALHRLEANIQPGNLPSIALARGAGFRLEGFSPALPADRRPVARPRALRDHRRRAGGSEEPELSRRGAPPRARRRDLGLRHDGLGLRLGLGLRRRRRAPAARDAGGSPRAGSRASAACRARRRGGRSDTAAPRRGPIMRISSRPCRRVIPVGSPRSSLVEKLPSVHTTRGSISSSWRNR